MQDKLHYNNYKPINKKNYQVHLCKSFCVNGLVT